MYEQQSQSGLEKATPTAPLLRPLSTGEVLDRTFSLYRANFWLFAAIGVLPAAVLTLTSAARLVLLAVQHQPQIPQAAAGPDALSRMMSVAFANQLYLFPGTLLFLAVYGLSHAATMAAVSRLNRGLATTATVAYRLTRPRWKRWIGVILRQFWSVMWPASLGLLLFVATAVLAARGRFGQASALGLGGVAGLLAMAALVLGILNFLRTMLAMPAAVEENLPTGAAIRRSRALVAGRKGRIFLALLLVYALQMVLGGIQLPLIFFAAATHGAQQVLLQAIQLLMQFVIAAILSPVASIALCLLYVDERVRREGYDIEVLMQSVFRQQEPQPELYPRFDQTA